MTEPGFDETVTTLGVAAVKRRFSDVLGRVQHHGSRYVIERHGTPVAAVVSLDDLARLGGAPPAGFAGFVGAFDDADELPGMLDQVVRERDAQSTRPAPSLRA